jgi:hypothetical protein
MRRHAPEQYRKLTGLDEYPAEAFVFGNECGERIKRVSRAWRLTLQRAKIVDLHFHDLRREFASRLMESGASLQEVQAWLGHANIAMTSRYLGVTDAGLQRALDRFETARPWADDSDGVRTTGAQSVVGASKSSLETPSESPANVVNLRGLVVWWAARGSNPGHPD